MSRSWEASYQGSERPSGWPSAPTTIMRNATLRGITVWRTSLGGVIANYANNANLSWFYNNYWKGARIWLYTNTTVAQRLGYIYDDTSFEFQRRFSGRMGDVAYANLIGTAPGMTVPVYQNLILGNTPVRATLTGFADTLRLAEHHIFGSSRLGMQTYASTGAPMNVRRQHLGLVNRGLSRKMPWHSEAYGDLIDSTAKSPWGNGDLVHGLKVARTVGLRYYELNDHLGNVFATVLDRKTGHLPWPGAPGYDYWKADVGSAQDYYPFGMEMPGRTYTLAGMDGRFGFNGQQRRDEVYGKGNLNTALFWEYDTRLGRRWNLDPVDQISQSNYSALSGNPISRIDPLGNEDDDISVNTKSKQYTVTKTNDPYDVLMEGSGRGNGGLKTSPNGQPVHYQKGSYQKSLDAKGYTQKAPLRGFQSEEFAVEMAALDWAGKLVFRGAKLVWGRAFGGAAKVAAGTGKDYAKLLVPTNDYDIIKTLHRGDDGIRNREYHDFFNI